MLAAATFASWLETGVSGGPACAASPAAYTEGLLALCRYSLSLSRPFSVCTPPASKSRASSAGAADEHLLRVAAAQGASAAERPMIDHRDAPARGAHAQCRDHGRGAAADHREVVAFHCLCV